LSVRLVNNIEDCTIKNCEAKRIFHYKDIDNDGAYVINEVSQYVF
jgi:hypothetical protein